MNSDLQTLLDWSEVWAPMIPLSVLFFRRQQPRSLRPVILYLWLGFLVNIAIDVIMAINLYVHRPDLTNNPLYNVHSVIRFACFSYYFIQLQKSSFSLLKKWLAIGSVIFLLVNFTFFENFFNHDSLSGNLLSTEAYLLLVYCMLYYLTELNDQENLFAGPHFWIVTGLCMYVVVNFFVFLFYVPMLQVDPDVSVNIWYVHNIAFIIFCIFLTKGFYVSRYQYSI